MSQEPRASHVHNHRGKSSEKLLDKELILAQLDIFPGQTILDAGCGNGYMSKEFAGLVEAGGRVYALDPDQQAITVLEAETKNTNITPILGDITQTTPLAAASLDLVYVATVVHGFSRSKMEAFQKEIKRLLKPKGVLAIVEIKKEPTPFGPPLDIRFSPEDLKEIITLVPKKTIDVGQYFYLQTFEKKA